MKKLLSLILSIIMLFSSVIFIYAAETGNTIRVAVNAEFPPFEYYENNKLCGFDIELMDTIGDRIGYKIEYVNLNFDKLIPAVVNGEVDCAVSAITVTAERESAVDFSRPYLTAKITNQPTEIEKYENYDNYAVVFPFDASEKSNLLLASGNRSVYADVNNAIEQFTKDGTIDKLIKKYKLDESLTDGGSIVTHSVANYTPTNTEEQKASSTSLSYSDWAAESINKAKEISIIDSTKAYDYQTPITREEFCEIIYNYVSMIGIPVPDDYIVESFTDTDSKKIATLSSMNIINGKSETEFAPDDNLTREEAAVILERMVNKTLPVEVTEMYFEFDDSTDISDWADSSIQIMCNMGIMTGVGNNKFAPKDIYTTEQAIATVIRVYEVQTQHLRENIDFGVIAGSDGPTSIIVGESTKKPAEIILGDDIKVSDFYIDEAVKLAEKTGKMAADKTFISMYVSSNVAEEVYGKFDSIDYSKPKEIYYVSFNPDKLAEFYRALYAEQGIDAEIDIVKALEYQKFNLSVLATMLNGRYGAETLAATSVLTNRKGYVMPKDYKEDFGLYMVYEGEYSALISFDKIGDNVIEARIQYVKNDEKDNILSFMSELYDAFGTSCISINKVRTN